MITRRQLEANRRNALKATGPDTPEGKAVACLNSLRHGLAGAHAFTSPEDPAFFRQVAVDPEAGTIFRPNGVDFCPDVLYSLVFGKPIRVLEPA